MGRYRLLVVHPMRNPETLRGPTRPAEMGVSPMTKRRSFVIGCSGIVAAPVFAHLTLRPSTGNQPQATATASLASTAQDRPAKSENVALRIDGWDSGADAGNDVWLQINSSWRATW